MSNAVPFIGIQALSPASGTVAPLAGPIQIDLAARPQLAEINPSQGHGNAAALLSLIRRPTVTFMLTTRCDLACPHCFSPRGMGIVDIEPELVMATADELSGISAVYFSGGEPFRWLGNAQHQMFLGLMHYVSQRVERLYIDTNGSFLPDDQSTANDLLREFPPNTRFVLSVDDYHAKALAAKGRSLASIFNTLHGAARHAGRGFEVNMRYPKKRGRSRDSQQATERRIAEGLGIDTQTFLDLQKCGHVHANSVCAQNAAQDLPPSETLLVSLRDFIEHTYQIESVGLFVNPRGQVIGNIHAAFMNTPPSFMVLGDLHRETLAHILWTRLLPGYYDYMRLHGGDVFGNFNERRFVERHPVEYLNPEDTEKAARILFASHVSAGRQVDRAELRSILGSPNSGIDWEIDTNWPLNTMIDIFGEEAVKEAVADAAQKFAKDLLSRKTDPIPWTGARGVSFFFRIRKGRLSFERSYPPAVDHENYHRADSESLAFCFAKALTGIEHKLSSLEQSRDNFARRFFFVAMYNYFADNIDSIRNSNNKILLREYINKLRIRLRLPPLDGLV